MKVSSCMEMAKNMKMASLCIDVCNCCTFKTYPTPSINSDLHWKSKKIGGKYKALKCMTFFSVGIGY